MRMYLRCLLSTAFIALFAAPGLAENRVALVVGNQNYLHGPDLRNPQADARAIADRLRGLGFSVTLALDQNLVAFGQSLNQFKSNLQDVDLALVYYAGHGVQVDGATYLIPTDGRMETRDDLATAITVNEIAAILQDDLRAGIILVDSCRDNPFYEARSRSFSDQQSGGGVDGPSLGLFIGYASQPGATASDGVGDHSPFTASLLDAIAQPGLEIERVMRKARLSVALATDGQQVPWSQSSLLGPVVLNDGHVAQSRDPGRDRKSNLIAALCQALGKPKDTCARNPRN